MIPGNLIVISVTLAPPAAKSDITCSLWKDSWESAQPLGYSRLPKIAPSMLITIFHQQTRSFHQRINSPLSPSSSSSSSVPSLNPFPVESDSRKGSLQLPFVCLSSALAIPLHRPPLSSIGNNLNNNSEISALISSGARPRPSPSRPPTIRTKIRHVNWIPLETALETRLPWKHAKGRSEERR